MSARTQGYIFVAITMFIWCSFTIASRINALWHISAWDIVALRFSIAFCILMPILIYKKDLAFLWKKEPVILALVGGVAYCLFVYSGFLYAPAAHAAIFLNGTMPIFTAIAGFIILKQPFDKHTWLSVIIMLCAMSLMSYLMSMSNHTGFSIGDLLFLASGFCWGVFTVFLRKWQLSAWHSMASVAIWSTIIYLPFYLLFLPKNFAEVQPIHLVLQGVFHGVFVVIIATLTYVAAIQRLGAFKTGSIVTLAPFIAAVLAVPLLNEPLSPAIACGLVGMAIGALQPWRWSFKDTLAVKLAEQKKREQEELEKHEN